ncbi:unnamed protein product, partial [marine sediment metagenome]
LAICNNKGFHVTFKNGWTVSVQFGAGNYCDNYEDMDYTPESPKESDNAEVWCFNKNGKNYPEDPLSHQTPEDILKLMNKISRKRK